ncbi:MAG: MFS transporter [Chloroflexota bacterium]
MNKYIALLKKRPAYRNLWLASLVSMTGDWFNAIASMVIVSKFTHSGLAISWILIARKLPIFLFAPIAGVFADRFNRKTILITTDILRAGIVLSFLWVDRAERVWLIYLLTTLQFIVSSFFEPAVSSILPSLVEGEKELLTANVLGSVTWSAMLAVGSALGGLFTTLFGVQAAIIVDGFTFLVSALLIFQIRFDRQTVPKPEKETTGFGDFVAGAKFVAQRPGVMLLATVKSFSQIASIDLIIVVLAQRYFAMNNQGTTALGIFYTAAGIGAIIGPLIANNFVEDAKRRKLYAAVMFGFIFIFFGWTVIGMTQSLWVISLAIIIRTMGGSVNWMYSSVLIQLEVPNQYLGRVFALDLAIFTLFASVFTWLQGYALDNLNLEPSALINILSVVIIIPIVIWAARIRHRNAQLKTNTT